MMFLPGLAVIFAGLLGGHGDVDKQVAKVFRDLHVKAVKLPAASLQKLTHHGDATRDLVRSLDADGVIACEVVKTSDGLTLRIVIYEHDGRLKTFSEVPLTAKGLTRDSLDVLRSNIGDDIASMRGTEKQPEPEPEIEIDPVPAKPMKPIVVAKPEKPVVVAKLDKPVAKPAAKPTPPPAKEEDHVAVSDSDDEDPFGGDKKTVRKPTAETTVTTEETAAADDAVSADEIAALTAGTDDDVLSARSARALHFGASVGMGVASRAFTPGPATLAGYSSAPVAAIVLDAHVQPTRRLSLSIGVEHTLQATTSMQDGTAAATTIAQWEAGGTYAFVQQPRFDLGARVGGGRRVFTIDSADPSRSPDGDYNYLIAGIDAAARLGSRVTLRTTAAFEPVLFGAEATEMAFGEAKRWAVEVGAALEVRLTPHIFSRATAQYQRFSWSWDQAGERGAGGAIDEYPSGAIAIGADY